MQKRRGRDRRKEGFNDGRNRGRGFQVDSPTETKTAKMNTSKKRLRAKCTDTGNALEHNVNGIKGGLFSLPCFPDNSLAGSFDVAGKELNQPK